MKLVLLVEDDPSRAEEIQACFPLGIRCIWARSAGAAIGILSRDEVDGILLDFDLNHSPHGDPQFTGETVATRICDTQRRSCPVFVHSQSPSGGRHVCKLLNQSGFSVDHLPWSDNAKAPLKAWLEELLASD